MPRPAPDVRMGRSVLVVLVCEAEEMDRYRERHGGTLFDFFVLSVAWLICSFSAGGTRRLTTAGLSHPIFPGTGPPRLTLARVGGW
jgi:hypothetical protein